MQRPRPLSEEECYLRCYGRRGGEDTVEVLPPGIPGTLPGADIMAERIRLAFEARLDAREPDAA